MKIESDLSIGDLRALNALFAEAFGERETYLGAPPSDAYLERILADPCVVALAAFEGETLIGALVAYEMKKLERETSEIYIYDLAVDAARRRRGVATALIGKAKEIARERGAWVVMVQADRDDPPAIALYTKLGVREDVFHFDLDPARP